MWLANHYPLLIMNLQVNPIKTKKKDKKKKKDEVNNNPATSLTNTNFVNNITNGTVTSPKAAGAGGGTIS